MKYLAGKLKCQVAAKTQASARLFIPLQGASLFQRAGERRINAAPVARYCARVAQICGELDTRSVSASRERMKTTL